MVSSTEVSVDGVDVDGVADGVGSLVHREVLSVVCMRRRGRPLVLSRKGVPNLPGREAGLFANADIIPTPSPWSSVAVFCVLHALL